MWIWMRRAWYARSPLEIQGIAPGFTPHHLLEEEAMTAVA
jgi:hypothetical protein